MSPETGFWEAAHIHFVNNDRDQICSFVSAQRIKHSESWHHEPGFAANRHQLGGHGKGNSAADETVPTLTRRLEARGIPSTEQTRRTYREMLFTTPGAAEFISGVIMQDETIHQNGTKGVPLVQVLADQGITPGIKVDTGAKRLAGAPSEMVTEGLDGLRDRLTHYNGLGARFAKWRAVIHITDGLPSRSCIHVNAHALARYAALCQEQELVPIVEPEVLTSGTHAIDRCEEVTSSVLFTVFNELNEQGVALEAMLLKPNMVIAGEDRSKQATVQEVAAPPCGACGGMSRRPSRGLSSSRADRMSGWQRRTSMQSTGFQGLSPGRSVFPLAGRCRIRR